MTESAEGAMTPEAEAREIIRDFNNTEWAQDLGHYGFQDLEKIIATALRKHQSRIGELEKELAEAKKEAERLKLAFKIVEDSQNV